MCEITIFFLQICCALIGLSLNNGIKFTAPGLFCGIIGCIVPPPEPESSQIQEIDLTIQFNTIQYNSIQFPRIANIKNHG